MLSENHGVVATVAVINAMLVVGMTMTNKLTILRFKILKQNDNRISYGVN